ncbi:MAG: hypothetical protein Q8J65_01230 [Nitrosomonadales bacterium]|nr:hypothetical protein [Nitrosomonadales bacterium]
MIDEEQKLTSSSHTAYYKAKAREIDDRFDLESWLAEAADRGDHEKFP